MADRRLEERHLADLHALAAELDVPTFRMLRREELVAAIRERGGDDVDSAAVSESEPAPAAAVGAAAEEPAEPDRQSEPADAADDGREEADEETAPVTGILDVMPRRYGFLRLSGLESADGDVYISASQIRRCELLPGDEVSGPARAARRGERHPALVHVDSVNGTEPSELERLEFEDLTPVPPTRRLSLGSPSAGSPEADALVRGMDLLCPLALGQRVLVRAAARSGRTTLLRGLAGALSAAAPSEDDRVRVGGGALAPAGPLRSVPIIVIVALVDERPEEATRWREQLAGAELALATAEMRPGEQVATVELALARAKRQVESGNDVVLIVDSLSRLAVAHHDAGAVKHLFGSGRETKEEGAGSLTVVATLLEGDDDDGALRAVLTTENAVVRLDPGLAAAGIVPAIDPSETRSTDEAVLRDADELEAVRKLRERLAGQESDQAARTLSELIEGSGDNDELLRGL